MEKYFFSVKRTSNPLIRLEKVVFFLSDPSMHDFCRTCEKLFHLEKWNIDMDSPLETIFFFFSAGDALHKHTLDVWVAKPSTRSWLAFHPKTQWIICYAPLKNNTFAWTFNHLSHVFMLISLISTNPRKKREKGMVYQKWQTDGLTTVKTVICSIETLLLGIIRYMKKGSLRS